MYQLSVDHLVVSEVKTGSERLENIKKTSKTQQNNIMANLIIIKNIHIRFLSSAIFSFQ